MMQKKALVFIFALVIISLNTGCGTDSTVTCNLEMYKEQTFPLMSVFSEVMDETQLGDAVSRAEARDKFEALLVRINNVECRESFPLKHETLEYAVRHTISALEYADKGDYEMATQLMNKASINIDAFFDWTMDID